MQRGDQRGCARIGQTVEDVLHLASGFDNAGPAQLSKLLRQQRLLQAERSLTKYRSNPSEGRSKD